jgi:hypothetical protein
MTEAGAEEATATSATKETEPQAGARANSRKNNVFVFRRFILDTFGGSVLHRVLDVAGGRGDLSWLLLNSSGACDSVVCDPSLTNHKSMEKTVAWLLDHPDELERRAVPGQDTHQPLAGLLHSGELDAAETLLGARHLQVRVTDALVSACREEERAEQPEPSSSSSAFASWFEAERAMFQTGGERECVAGGGDPTIAEAPEALRTIRGASLVVGFHPDQATEAAIDLALLLRVPFAVVPCCVMQHEFPDRLRPNGKLVKTHGQLMDFLRLKHPRMRSAELPLISGSAKRVVLYLLAEDYDGDDAEGEHICRDCSV